MTLLDTPEGRKAVEAGQAASRVDDIALTQAEAEAIILAALPHLRKAIAEEIREEYRGVPYPERFSALGVADFVEGV